MPLADFKVKLQQMTRKQLDAREDELKVFKDAWWADPSYMRGGKRPERPEHLWDESLHIYEEIQARLRCQACGFFGCQCADRG